MKVVSIVGARPQFVKAGAVSREIRKVAAEVLVHTGQHYDHTLSDVFFEQLGLPAPDRQLGIGSGSHGAQTAGMLAAIEDVLLGEKPDWVLVYGDTNSTLAGALAAAKLNTPVAHVEAGLRSFNRTMPEEINRVVADHLSTLAFCPTGTAVRNLAAEGIVEGVHLVGDVMLDALRLMAPRAAVEAPAVLGRFGLSAGRYILATIHRAANTDDPDALGALLRAFSRLDYDVIFPVHPRTGKAISSFGLAPSTNVRLCAPVGYIEMLALEQNAKMILTDSGGVQKEAYVLEVPCVTMRQETEWVETVAAGWNVLVGADADKICAAVQSFSPNGTHPPLFGDGTAARQIAQILSECRRAA